MGRERFQLLKGMLPEEVTVVGIDEHTALIMDVEAGACQVMGRGGVTVMRGDREVQYRAGEGFPCAELGPFEVPEPEAGIPEDVWESVLAAERESETAPTSGPPPEVLALVEEREAARGERDWAASDGLRQRIAELGWEVRDTPGGPELWPR